ncbi:MAG: sodium:solute symporter [Rhodothermales bacterium]
MLTTIDYVVIVLYLAGVAIFGIRAGGRQTNTADYFLGSRDLPWWAVCFSIVATETSTLTVIGIPAVAYGGTLTFLQLTLGYLIGRIAVSAIFLPQYFKGELATAYAFLGNRYGDTMRGTASVTFLVTRLLADGVRLFATAIPLKVIADTAGLELSYFSIIAVIAIVTVIYTIIGGIKAVIWMDVVQMAVYVGGAIGAVYVLLGEVPSDWWMHAAEAGKTQIVDFAFDESLATWLTNPYTFLAAVVGGAIFSMASHGTDQLIVQRVLTCRNLADGKKALIGSGVVVMFQFALFLLVGLLLWSLYGGASIEELGLTRGDEIFPMFIIEGLPPGVSGLLLAGIVAAAMSTLSSSLNSLASSSVMDLYERIRGRPIDEDRALFVSRGFTMFWGVAFIFFATLFEDQTNPVVELGLAIASFTYGGLLGIFLLGLVNKSTRELDAVISFLVTIAFMTWVIFAVWHEPDAGWIVAFMPADEVVAERGLEAIGWPWYTAIGAGVNLAIGSLLGLRHR